MDRWPNGPLGSLGPIGPQELSLLVDRLSYRDKGQKGSGKATGPIVPLDLCPEGPKGEKGTAGPLGAYWA